MPSGQTEYDLRAVNLDFLRDLLDCGDRGKRIPRLVEKAIPERAERFRYEGEIPQFGTTLPGAPTYYGTAGAKFCNSLAFTVPPESSGVINHICFAEHYPGLFHGAKYHLLINGALDPEFGRVGHNVGSLAHPLDVWIPLHPASQVGIMIECPWLPSWFSYGGSGQPSFTWNFSIQGYYLPVHYFDAEESNEGAA